MKRISVGVLLSLVVASIMLTACVQQQQTEMVNGVSFPVNESGQTYGNYGDANVSDASTVNELEDSLPDLIEAEAEDGVRGYITKEDYLSGEKDVNLYANDGSTIIGQFNSTN